MSSRPYQSAAHDAIFKEFETVNSTLVEMATGTGKTVLISMVAKTMASKGKRILVIAHRSELIFQAKDKIERFTGLTCGIEMGDFKTTNQASFFHSREQVIIASVQTLSRGGDGGGRIGKFDPMDFGLVICDEAHHGVAATYQSIFNYFRTNPDCKILGLTATADRADEESLGQIFETVAYEYGILDAIRDGWLVPIDQQFVSVDDLDLSSVRTTAGDLNGADLAAVFESEKPLHKVASSTIDIIGSYRCLGFAASVDHARMLTEIFNRHRPGMASSVNGSTDLDERKQIITDFAAGKIQFLWNCGVFLEGFDDSGIEFVVMGRPTKSRALYAQMCGRGTRPHDSIAHRLNDAPGAMLRRGMIARSCKPNVRIIDFVGNSGKHKLITTADILGGRISEVATQAAVQAAQRSGRPVRMAVVLEEEEKRQTEKKQRQLEEQARKAKLTAKSSFKTQSIDPFDLMSIKPEKNNGSDRGKKLSEKQRAMMRDKMGLDPDKYEYIQAKQLIDAQFRRWNEGLCSLKQIATLRRYGIDATNFKFETARAKLDVIAANGWRVPTDQPATVASQEPVYADAGGGDIPF